MTQPEDRPRESSADAACHIVQVRLRRKPKPGDRAICATLPAEVVEAIGTAAAGWRDLRYASKRLAAVREQYALSGLVVWYSAEDKLPDVPGPLTVPIEPLELNETRSPLYELAGVAAGRADPEALRTARWRRLMLRLGLPVAIILPQLSNAIVQIAIHRKPWIMGMWLAIIGSLVIGGLVHWWLSDQWLLVPGGLVLRKSFVGKVGVSLRRFTPHDTLMIIRPLVTGYLIELCQKGRVVSRRRVTPLECAAALGAWQSPIAAPSMERFSDWK